MIRNPPIDQAIDQQTLAGAGERLGQTHAVVGGGHDLAIWVSHCAQPEGVALIRVANDVGGSARDDHMFAGQQPLLIVVERLDIAIALVILDLGQLPPAAVAAAVTCVVEVAHIIGIDAAGTGAVGAEMLAHQTVQAVVVSWLPMVVVVQLPLSSLSRLVSNPWVGALW